MHSQFNALIIEPNPTVRGYLWQATLASPHFHRVKAVSKIESALERLNEHPFDCILVSSNFPREEIESFIERAKSTNGGKEAAYIWVLRAKHQSSNNIAQGLLGGLNGFLLEPFSADSLRRVAIAAAKVKKEFDRQRTEAALRIIVSDVMKALDALALAQSASAEVNRSRKEFAKAAAALKTIPTEDRDLYYKVACELFETAPPKPSIGYKGASKRIKQRLTKKQAAGG
ncbi:MAG: response regulator [Deltaproteobacteria bacterium]|nr:response regulator [Deltaproteobacteria bacterium]